MTSLRLLVATLLLAGPLSAAEFTLPLIHALQTNAVGSYKLSPVWTGQCAVVVASGVFTKPEPPVFATNRYTLKFDLGVVTPKGPIGNVGPRAVAMHDTNGGYRALHTLRESLPSDAKLKMSATAGDLEKILGAPHGFPEPTGYGPHPRNRWNWRFFALNGDASLETLQVTAIADKRVTAKEARIEGLEILRGKAWPEVKAAKKD
jgi:hypothetical protein